MLGSLICSRMRILWLLAAAAAVAATAQNDCSLGACYPPSTDLLLGRSHQLRASSTCGLTDSEIYCTPHQRKMRCCPCDSRNPNGQLAHTMKEILTTSGPNRWWQSSKGVNPVVLQFDLNNLFQLDNLVLSFKGPRPKALLIERTLDNGRRWQPVLYLAKNCQEAFPGIQTNSPISLEQIYCHTLQPHADPYQDETIEFSPLSQYLYAPVSDSQKIEDKAGLTGLRVTLTELGDVPFYPGRSFSKFFALKEMRVMGTCMCHGHADRCQAQEYNNPGTDTIQVNHVCDCRHNTAGENCERCADFYNDLPWRPAEEGNTHTCQRCECNNHAQRCHFDPAVYEASGRRSGGVCEGCMHHTTGPKCDRCAPGYQPNPRSRMDRPDACIRCPCNAEGTVNGAQCEDSAGYCPCKANVEGPYCDRCRKGFHSLSSSDPLGCKKCSCSPVGSLSILCDPVTGQCPCRPFFHGLTCDACSKGYWKPPQSEVCEPCGCDPTWSTSDTCDQRTGQCPCRRDFGGRTCSQCADGSYGTPLSGCRPCQCDTRGTLPEVCNRKTGQCLCRVGVTGPRCESCSRGHCDSFPACELCPDCFFAMDSQRRNVSLALDKLSFRLPSLPGGGGDLGSFGPRLQELEAGLAQIRKSVSRPPKTVTQLEDALFLLNKLGEDLKKVNGGLPPPVRDPGLEAELDKLRDLLNNISAIYQAKKDSTGIVIDPDDAERLDVIKNAYNESTVAAKKVNSTENTIKEVRDIREKMEDIQNQVQPNNTRDLSQLKNNMASQPDLTPAAKQVCGSARSEPCTPLQCEGDALCPAEGSPLCQNGTQCVGALPLSKRADADVTDVKDRLANLSLKITKAAEMLQNAQEKTNTVREVAKDLSNKTTTARDRLEDDLKDTRNIVQNLKDFLTDPSSNLTQVQEISEWIMNASLPVSLPALEKKLEELKNLAASLPNTENVLKEAKPHLDTARKMLQEAEAARVKALEHKDNVDKLLKDLDAGNSSLSDLERKLEDTLDVIRSVNDNLTQAEDRLKPAEKALTDTEALTTPMKDQLEELKKLLEDAKQKAPEALQTAGKAEEEAAAAQPILKSLEEQLDRLKNKTGPGAPGETTPLAEKVEKLKEKAKTLTNITLNMTGALEGKADSLRGLQDEIIQQSAKLAGLDTKLKDILQTIRKRADELRSCSA
ncbi:laminin subunit beta-3 [Gambusia affinis]|uniref:laminin subunit beta-3 n=1 Tax=Gambusia affinis TaxID=33528 RepID=UPI001CDD86FA|nr:laminin subunit beta-3 [Gambusia affinis]XP_043977387.1 laminin subunit beta-3 [Gambusia affinis]XP_043977388.1 laminin subunit beta-3 [Gambusia affinis]